MLVRILLLADDARQGRRLRRLLSHTDALISEATRRQGLWEHLARDNYDVLLLGRAALPEPVADLVSTLRKLPDRPEIVLLQEQDDPADRAELLASGCMAVVVAGLPDPILGQTLEALIARRRESALTRLRAEQRQPSFRLTDFASASAAMERLLALAARVVSSDSSLLILGETGVGKEWLARAIHAEGRRGAAPFIAVNCAAVPDTLLESELFGHEKGAFTGATRSRRGHFELAHRGTVFLDEIADMSPHLQAKLLRVLQERKIQRLGAEEPIAIDVRIMAATNRELDQEMARGAFRRDLFYRLGVVSLTIPPLRERREDIPTLAASYLDQFSRQLGRPVRGFTDEVLAALTGYSWPGNVRELINVVERSVLLASGGLVTVHDLPEAMVGPRAAHRSAAAALGSLAGAHLALDGWYDKPLAALHTELLGNLERAYLDEQLRRAGGRIGAAAERSGITPRTLYNKMRQLGLRKESYRVGAG